MVGVPGRSKACKTCKQRKVACSLERPICKVCTKSNRECGGYQRERIFILDARTQKDAQATPPKVCAPTPPQKHVPIPNKQAERKPPDLQGTISLKNAYISLWTLQSPTARALYREQIISEFLYSYLPNGSTANWLYMLPSHPHFTAALEASSLAVCTAHLGHINSSPTLTQESLKFYVQALWELQKALWSDDLMYRDETLAACMLLIMYEVTECPDKTIGAWQGHMAGCSKLFETRGPDSFNEEFGHKLFMTFRQLEIQQAIVMKRDTFLASAEWREKPWKSRPKPITQQLLDVESEVAAGIANVYANPPSESPEKFVMVLLETLEKSWVLDARLSAFHARFEAQADGPLYWSTLSKGFGNNSPKEQTQISIFPVAFQFPNLTTAHTCMLYWALTSILWSGMAKIYELLTAMQTEAQLQGSTTISSFMPIASPDSDHSGHASPDPASPALSAIDLDLSLFARLPPLEHRADLTQPAKNICQSLEYCMSSKQGTVAAAAAVFPLKVAIEALCESGCMKEMEWAKDVFEMISGRGVELLKHLEHKLEKRAYLPG
ncbi:uncharacterized protein LY89DRAFT_740167 [Mollisia scopiformis]|uniref:Zn(2)-C6 fungal-type domain-containing protein n=1 Tax=Mollisia scopiformis TaxID=149040 RepID=A0A132BDI9_MOLSC|nr:uncharacterized protein LY89DRAFT_740167 [Mollisia scopiformis]KUJ10456.1 hypothetical protein LY89DRAFT_740167 [Mollisia scopiformis]